MEDSAPERASGSATYTPAADHPFPDARLNHCIEHVRADTEIRAFLDAQNVNPVTRKQYNDHGTEHVEIVTDRALSLYELLKRDGVGFNGARDQGLEEADEPVIIHLAATLHDIGHIVHRDDHPYYSIPLANRLLDRLLPELGYDTSETVRMKGEILHAILCHHTAEQPLTAEAGVVRIADALDMERGRSRIPYEEGGRGINTLSSQAIKRVSLRPGEDRSVLVEIEMTDAVGVFQVDELLKAKVEGSSLEAQIRIVALNIDEESGQRLVERIEL